MRTGNFEDYVCLDDENEIEVYVEWEGYYEAARGMGGPWEDSSPAEGDMTLVKVEPEGEWPEGLSKRQFADAVERASDRLTDRAWEEYHDAD